MTLAFIITAVVAGILFILWEAGRENNNEYVSTIAQLQNRITQLENVPAVPVRVQQTPLTPELLDDVIRNNGFVPVRDQEGWITFKYQGEHYFISTDILPIVHFFKGFNVENGTDFELMKEASELAMKEMWNGQIIVTKENSTISFKILGIEKSVEHFSDSFMDYIEMLNKLIDCHIYFCQKLEIERRESSKKESQMEISPKQAKVLS